MKEEHLQIDFNCQVRNPRRYNENCSIEEAILFVMHSKTRQDLIKSKHLKKYLLIVQQLERSGSQKQLVFQNTNNFLHNWQHHKQRKNLCIIHWIR
jgi:hypothetical protein